MAGPEHAIADADVLDEEWMPARAPVEPVPRTRLPAAAPPAPLAHLIAADSPESHHRIVEALLRATGHEWLAYGVLETAGERVRPASLWTVHAHVEWVRRYVDRAYHEVDPRLDDAAASSLPCAWTLESLEERAQGQPQQSMLRHFISDLADAGMRSGVLLMLPGEGERRRHFMSLATHRPCRQPMEDAALGRVLTLGLCLNEYFTRHSALPEMPVRSVELLSGVQREILGHVVRGESDKRIAHLLRMSSHAVDYHMRRLRHRFAVRNRVQLAQVCRAMLR